MRQGRSIVRIFVSILTILLVILPIGLWSALALWFRAPGPAWLNGVLAGSFALIGLVTAIAVLRGRRLPMIFVFAIAFAAVLAWWSTITPPAQADWSPDVARQVTGTIAGDTLTLTNVRDFDWTSNEVFAERWVTRSYDLSRLRTLDLFLSYWAGPQLAHVIMSFGFDDGQFLAWSIEVRRQRGGVFSPLADMFKNSPLVIVAADERDVVRVRSNVRGEDVRLFRLRTPPARARALLEEYVNDSNELAARPAFYHSIMTNCTTVVVRLMRAAGGTLPFDWRLIVNGFLPGYLYEQGALDTRHTLDETIALARINERALAAGESADFARRIRLGVPSPHAPRLP